MSDIFCLQRDEKSCENSILIYKVVSVSVNKLTTQIQRLQLSTVF